MFAKLFVEYINIDFVYKNSFRYNYVVMANFFIIHGPWSKFRTEHYLGAMWWLGYFSRIYYFTYHFMIHQDTYFRMLDCASR